MKALFIGLLVLLAAVGLALAVRDDPGYVMITLQGWTIEASFTVFAMGMALAFIAFYWLFRFLGASRRLPRWVSHRRRLRRDRQALRQLSRGYILLSSYRWREAESLLTASAREQKDTFMHYLLAAKAAQKQGALDRCRGYLARARSANRRGMVTAGLVELEALIDHGRFDEAETAFRGLMARSAKDQGVLALGRRLFVESERWEGMLLLLPQLRSSGLMTLEQKNALEVRAYKGIFTQAVKENDGQRLLKVWARAPRALRRTPAVVIDYVEHLMMLGFGDAAETVIHKALQSQWHERLVKAYGLVESADSMRQLHRAEAWLKSHRHDPVLLLTMGRLCLRNEQWERARKYFEESFALTPFPETCRVLAHLLELQGEEAAALEYYRQGLLLVSDGSEQGDELPELLEKAPQAIRVAALDAEQSENKELILQAQ